MRVHLVNPEPTCRSAPPSSRRAGCSCWPRPRPSGSATPVIVDETLEQFDPATVQPGDVVGIGIHTANALRGYEHRQTPRAQRGACVVFGGIHSTLYPDEVARARRARTPW